jgi:hypothetical protein
MGVIQVADADRRSELPTLNSLKVGVGTHLLTLMLPYGG